MDPSSVSCAEPSSDDAIAAVLRAMVRKGRPSEESIDFAFP